MIKIVRYVDVLRAILLDSIGEIDRYLVTRDLVSDASLNVTQFLLGDPRMCGGRVEGEQIPHETPCNADAPGRIEDSAPSGVSDDKSAQEVSYPDAETEP